MASFVTVVDTSARRVKVKTTPEKSLSEILQEACTGWRYNASQYGLKNNNKTLDISRTIRLSGLSSGAKLELVKLSKTPSAVSVALQLPDGEKEGVPNGRMTEKFSSTASLWQILRGFESATAGGLGTQKNFTGRGVPSMANGSSGAGRLYYESPVLRIMGREYASLLDLQKSLGQLGFNGGSVLLHLSFRTSELPLEEAQKDIEDYFKSLELEDNDAHGAHSAAVGSEASVPPAPVAGAEQESRIPETKVLTEPMAQDEPATNALRPSPTPMVDGIEESSEHNDPAKDIIPPPNIDGISQTSAHRSSDSGVVVNGEKRKASTPLSGERSYFPGFSDIEPSSGSQPENVPPIASSASKEGKKVNTILLNIDSPLLEASVTGPNHRPISVYAPPSSTTPQAARRPHDEQDYEPTIAQQQRYQAHLGKISQQQRLQSDAEIEAQRKAKTEKLAGINTVEVKVRFPNQMQVVASFNNLDTSSTLYDHVRGLMEHESEPFSLKFSSPKGSMIVPKDKPVRLISDLGMVGRILVTAVWDDGASLDARNGPIVKAKFREAAQEIQVKEFEGTVDEKPNLGWGRLGEGKSQGDSKSSKASKLLNRLRKK